MHCCYMPKGIFRMLDRCFATNVACLTAFSFAKYSSRQCKRHIPVPGLRIQFPSATGYDDILLAIH